MAGINDLLPSGTYRPPAVTIPGQAPPVTIRAPADPAAQDPAAAPVSDADKANAHAAFTNGSVLRGIRDSATAVNREVATQPGGDGGGAGRGFVNPTPAVIAQDPYPAGIRGAADAPPPVAAPAPVATAPADDAAPAGSPYPVVPGGPTATNQEVLSAAKAVDAFGPGAHDAAGNGGQAAIADTGNLGANSDHNRNFDAGMLQNRVDSAIRLGGRNGPAQAQALAAGFQANKANTSAEAIARLREAGETQRAIAANATNTRIHSADNEVAIRGQDTALQGHRMTNAVAIQQQQRDQFNKDRSYQMDVQKFGTEVAQKNLAQREASEKNVHEQIGTMIPPGADGKPDTATAATYAAGLSARLAQTQSQLEHHLVDHPEDTQAAANLQKIKSQGLGALEPDDVHKFVIGEQAKQVAQDNHSALNPFGGTAVQGDAPITSLRRRPGLISDDYISNRGDVIPARALDKPGSTFGLGGQRSIQYDPLKTIRGSN